MTAKACIKSMRIRTLPLSMAGIITGIGLASTISNPDAIEVVLLIITAAFLQILSNLSNELGDILHGTDTAERQGIHYSIMDGEMTIDQMKKLIMAITILCLASGMAMIYVSFDTLLSVGALSFAAIGAITVWAAKHYTMGKNPYGYRGLGDIAVFLFFGLATVLGSGYLCSHTLLWTWLLPASAIGFWSVGVLNVNNIRDMKTDAATRTTVALKLGLRNARIYQTILVAAGWLAMIFFTISRQKEGSEQGSEWLRYLYLLSVPLFVIHLRGVCTRIDRALDPMLPILVISTFITSILFAVGL